MKFNKIEKIILTLGGLSIAIIVLLMIGQIVLDRQLNQTPENTTVLNEVNPPNVSVVKLEAEPYVSDIYPEQVKTIPIEEIPVKANNNYVSDIINTTPQTNESSKELKLNKSISTKPKKSGGGGKSSTSSVTVSNPPPPTPIIVVEPIVRWGSLRNDSWDNVTLPFELNTTNISYIDVAKRSIWHMQNQMVYEYPLRPDNVSKVYFMKDFQYAFDIIGFTHIYWLYNYTITTSAMDFTYNNTLNDTFVFQKISRVNGTEPLWDVQLYSTESYYGSMSNTIHLFLYTYYLNETIGYPIDDYKLNVMNNYVNWYLATWDTNNNYLIETCLKADWRDTCTNTSVNDIENLYENIQLYRLAIKMNRTDIVEKLKPQLESYWDGQTYLISRRMNTNESTQPNIIGTASYGLLLWTDLPNETQRNYIIEQLERIGSERGYQGVITWPCVENLNYNCSYWGEEKDFYGELDNAGLWSMYQGWYIEYLLQGNQTQKEMGLHWLNRYVEQLDHYGFCEANSDHCGWPYSAESGVANPSSVLNLMRLAGLIYNGTELEVGFWNETIEVVE